MDFVKVVLLGASGVGKTSIVQRFVHNEFTEKYMPTEQKETYYPSVIINDHLYELKISDIPVIPYFPMNSYYEWSHFRFYGLRSATAYILVFDLSNVDSFQYVRSMRDQMMESRDMKHVPIIIVGSKQDLIGADRSSNGGLVVSASNNAVSSNHLDSNQRRRRDIANLVKKHWKCNYVECSAKYNWGIVAVFKELMEVIDSLDPNKNSNKEVYSSPMIDNIHDAFDELDLDYLEDPHNRRRNRATTPLKEFSPDSVDLVKVVLLGAPCVGKTSIIQQFVWNEFDDKYVSTDRKHTYYPSVIINDRLYELKISDIPVIPYFPVNAYYEWTDYRFYGLRSATAYILVFDLSNIDTFQYVRTLRDQMIESRDMSDVPLVIVGNKQDLIVGKDRASRNTSPTQFPVHQGWSEINRQKRDDIVSLVTKHWKCTYIECSAKYNWKVMHLFKVIMEMIDSSCMFQQQGEDYSSAVESALDDNGKEMENNLDTRTGRPWEAAAVTRLDDKWIVERGVGFLTYRLDNVPLHLLDLFLGQ